jgi:chemotaxis protein MotB
MGVFSVASGPTVQVKAAAVPNPAPPALPATQVVNDLAPQSAHPKAAVPLSQIKNELEGALSEEISKHQVEMRLGSDGLIVSLREVGFFNSGEAQLLPGADQILTHVAQVLGPAGYQIRVEGHTDDVPINNSHYHSNWELSTARATQVVLMMVKKCGFQPQHVSVAGYAQYQPVAGNATDEGRRRNRRIDLVVVTGPPASAPAPETAQVPQ